MRHWTEFSVEIPLPVALPSGELEPMESLMFRGLADRDDALYDQVNHPRAMTNVLTASLIGINGRIRKIDAVLARKIFLRMDIPVRHYVFDELLLGSDPDGDVRDEIRCANQMCRKILEVAPIVRTAVPLKANASEAERKASAWLIESQLELELKHPVYFPLSGKDDIEIATLIIGHGNGEHHELAADILRDQGADAAMRALRVKRIIRTVPEVPLITSDIVGQLSKPDQKRWQQWDAKNSIVRTIQDARCPDCGMLTSYAKNRAAFF